MANIGNPKTNPSDTKYAAKRNDGGKKKQNQQEKQNNTNQTNKQNMPKSSNKRNNQNNKDNTRNPKENAKQKAKEQAATTAMSALGVPAPLAKALSKPVVNKLDKQQNKAGNGLLPEQQKIKQGQERLNNIRNLAGAMNESKKQKETENMEEEEQNPSLMDQAQDIKAKADNISGIIKVIKMIPPPAWLIIFGVGVFFIILMVLISYFSTVKDAFSMDNSKNYIQENISINNNNNTNSAIDLNNVKLRYPTTTKQISAGYPNYSDGSYHGGIDFPVATGSEVYATEAGTVQVSQALRTSTGEYRSFGEYIVIDHGNGLTTLYGHNSERLVNVGDKVTKGQVIAKSGSTGNSTGPHVHFEVRINNKQVDPMKYLSDE